MLKKYLALFLFSSAAFVTFGQAADENNAGEQDNNSGAQTEPSILIDFGDLPPGYMPEPGEIYERQWSPQTLRRDPETLNNEDPTLVDYSNQLGSQYSQENVDNMRTSLAIDRWEVELSHSSWTINNANNSYVVAYKVKPESSRYADDPQNPENVLAARVLFPTGNFNSKAWIKPAFEIPAYSPQPEGTANPYNPNNEEPNGQFIGRGVLRNVGDIRSIDVNVYGRRFPYDLRLVVDHTDIGRRIYNMGSLNFSGWRTLTWTNPNYIADVRKRTAEPKPEYPNGRPSMILRSLQIDRNASTGLGGDFVFYIKDIQVIFDKALPEIFDSEIDDESIWQVITNETLSMIGDGKQRSAYTQELRYLARESRTGVEYPDQNTPIERN